MNKGQTAQDVTAVQSKSCRLLLLMMALLVVLPAWGAGGVLIVGDTNRSYFRSFNTSLAANLGRNNIDVTVTDIEKLEGVTLNGGAFRCIVTVGNEAARRVSVKPLQIPVIYALVTESFSRELYPEAEGQLPHPFLLIDQPIGRLMSLVRSSMPNRHKLGVLYGPYSIRYRGEVRHQAANADLQLIEKEVGDTNQLGSVMSSFKGNADLLLTLPDPTVVNEGTAKTLILGAYMDNLPLVGYSQALVKAGALMSVYSTPEQLGKQGAELISNTFWNDAARKGGLIYPHYYEVSVNYQVADALQIELPSENELKERLEKLEGMR